MSLAVYIPAYKEPIELAEMKNHLKQEVSITDDDALIESLTTAARDVIETATGANVPRSRVMLATTFDLVLENFPWCSYIKIPRVPIVSVTSITYVDANGDTQTLSASAYVAVDLDKVGPVIHLAYNESWPATRYQPNAVTVRFIAGMAATFTAVAATNVCTVFGRTFSTGDRVQVMNSGGSLPGGLAVLTTYFVISASGSTFSLSLTSGGSAVDITSTGNGTHFIALDMIGFETLRAAIKLLVGHLYYNREAVLVTGMNPIELPMAVNALVASQHA